MTNQAQGKPWGGHTPLPWFAGTLEGDLDDRTVSVGPYDAADRVVNCHYEDTILTVWDNPNLAADDGLHAQANAALIVERVNKGPAADAMAEALAELIRWHIKRGPRDEPLGESEQEPEMNAAVKALAAYRGEQP